MMETRKACFRVESSQETGEVMLLIATACGFPPVMAWPDVVQLREFAEMLMDICSRIDKKSDCTGEIPESIIRGFSKEE